MLTRPKTLTHAPYADARSRPFSIGMRPLSPLGLFEVDADYADYLAEKKALLETKRDAVFRAEADTLAAQALVLDRVLDDLVTRHGELVETDGNAVTVTPLDTRYAIGDFAAAPLELASLLVQEDLCIMRRGEDGWRLAAASVCFPSSWPLAEKFSRSMDAIHAPVPGFAGRMVTVIERIFDNLQMDGPVERFNWSLYADPELHHPEPHAEKFDALDDEALAAALTVRVERQTLSRLETGDDILFTIRIHRDPLSAFATHPQRTDLATGLKTQILAMSDDQLAYKGFSRVRDRILAILDRMAA